MTDIQRATRFHYLQQQAFGGKIDGQTGAMGPLAQCFGLGHGPGDKVVAIHSVSLPSTCGQEGDHGGEEYWADVEKCVCVDEDHPPPIGVQIPPFDDPSSVFVSPPVSPR